MTTRQALQSAIVILAALAALGCSSAPKDASPGEVSSVLDQAMRNARSGSSRLTMKDNGLEMRRWVINDDLNRIASALTMYGQPAPMGERMRQTLERNGFRVWRVPAPDVQSLLEGLGGSTVDQEWWLGQSPDWTEIHARSLGGRLRGIAVDGAVRTFNGGAFSLLMRSWTLKTTDGPRMQFEMIPWYAQQDGGDLRRVLQLEEPEGEIFPTLLAQLALESGYAYVLTCETPTVDWNRAASERGGGTTISVPEGGEVRGSVGPPGWVGPDPGGPWTIGDALLRGAAEIGNRGVIVLIPHLPERLYPVEMLVESDQREASDVEAPMTTPGNGNE